jgi:hypothetical protein
LATAGVTQSPIVSQAETRQDTRNYEVLRARDPFHHAEVHRDGPLVLKEVGHWGPAVAALLRHLAAVGFDGAPRLAGSGFDAQGRVQLNYIEGDLQATGPWSLEATHAIGRLVRELHDAARTFDPPIGVSWYPWFGRDLGRGPRQIGHCDIAPWNIIVRDGQPVALIDWDFAGPVDPVVDFAQACWLNAKLFDDVVAERENLTSPPERAHQLRVMVDAYGLPARQRRNFMERIIEVAVCAAAWEADDSGLSPDATDHGRLWWALAWRARSAAWLIRHRRELEAALA